jgi:hypothetical protein
MFANEIIERYIEALLEVPDIWSKFSSAPVFPALRRASGLFQVLERYGASAGTRTRTLLKTGT